MSSPVSVKSFKTKYINLPNLTKKSKIQKRVSVKKILALIQIVPKSDLGFGRTLALIAYCPYRYTVFILQNFLAASCGNKKAGDEGHLVQQSSKLGQSLYEFVLYLLYTHKET